VSAEGTIYTAAVAAATVLQRGRAHVSAEGVSSPASTRAQKWLQRGRAHVSAEGSALAILDYHPTIGFNGAALT